MNGLKNLSRLQLAGLQNDVRDAVGNRDGVPENESLQAGRVGRASAQPIWGRTKALVGTGLSKSDEAASVEAFVATNSQRAALTAGFALPKGAVNPSTTLLEAQKAVAMVRFSRPPGSITELTVKAAGSVAGVEIAPRELFVQRWKPTVPPNGNVVVLAPGYIQSGRDFYEQANLLNQRGYDVLVMDQQWTGYSEGAAGRIDRGFGVTRDVAAVMARAATLARTEYANSSEPLEDRVLLAGTSMGGGIGGLGFLTFNDTGSIALEGSDALPRGLSAVLQAPFFRSSDNALNSAYRVLAQSPLKHVQLAPLEVGSLVSERSAQQKLVNRMNEEQTRVTPHALLASLDDLATLKATLERGERPQGIVSVLAARGDRIASFAATEETVNLLNSGGDRPRAFLTVQQGDNHIANEVPGLQVDLATALEQVKAEQARRRSGGD